MAIDPADFSISWGTPRKGIVWATVIHDPSGRSFQLKASKVATDAWVASGDISQARNQWVKEKGVEYLENILYRESDVGIQEKLITRAKSHRDNVIAAKEFIDDVKTQYPEQADRLPTITITGGED